MGLSNDLMSQFAKATVDKRVETETTVYGTVVEYNDKYYVKLDGSDRLTPMPATAEALPNDRVSIKIKNHTATITGNVSSPAARVGRVEEIDGKLAVYIPKIEADSAAIKVIESKYVKTEQLDAIEGRFDTLEANDVTINEKLTAKEADIEKLKADFAEFERVDADYAKIKDLEAATGRIDILESDVADIDTLMFGSASGKVVHSDFANMLVQQVNQALITDAMIKSVSADAITAGTIDANTVSIVSEGGRLVLEKEQIKISDESGNIRVLIGDTKRDGNDIDDKDRYCICIWDADGNPIFDATGITEYAVRDELIKTSMIADAAITAGKIDMESLFSEINKEDGTQYIKSSKVYFDDEEQTLDVTFKQMVTDVEGLSEDVSSQGTQLSVIQGQIDSKIWQQDIDSAKGEMSTKYSEMEQTVEGFKTSVRETYATKDDLENIEIGNIEVGGRNLLVDTNTSKSVGHVSMENVDGVDITVDYVASESDIVTDYTGYLNIFAGWASDVQLFYENALRVWLKPDTDYIVSFDIACQVMSIDAVEFRPLIGICNKQGQNTQAAYTLASEIYSDDNMWQHVTCKLRTEHSIPGRTPLAEQTLCIKFGQTVYIDVLWIKNLKLEEGTVATAWTPAPEDQATKGDVETLTDKYAEFEQTIDGVKATVGETYAMLEVSGRNLIVRRGELRDTYVISNGSVIDSESGYQSATMLDTIRVEGGQDYTFSKDESVLKYFFRWAWYDKDMNVLGRTTTDASTFTWTAPANAVYIRVSYPYTDGGKPKLEKGSEATDYCPSLEDVGIDLVNKYATIVDMEASIKVESDNITSSVSKKYTTKDEFNNLEIGGCNLIKNSDFSNGTSLWVPVGITTSIETDDTYGTCLKITSTDVGSSNQRIYPSTTENFIHKSDANGKPGRYSLSFYAKTDSEATLQTNIAGGTAGVKNYTLSTEWQRFTHTYDASSGSITFWLNEAGATAYITRVQMERGDKVTDWKPASDEIVTNTDLDGVTVRVEESETKIQQLSNAISSLVKDKNGESLMIQDGDSWYFNTSSIQGTLDDVAENLNTLLEEFGSIDAVVEELQSRVNELGGLTEYVRIGTYKYVDEQGVTQTVPSIELGESDSEFKQRVTNTKSIFLDGISAKTSVSKDGILTENIEITSELKTSGLIEVTDSGNDSYISKVNYIWKVRKNGNFGLIYDGWLG